MFVLTAFLGLGVALIELLLKLSDSGQRSIEAMQLAARLARVVRADVRAAERVETPPGAVPPFTDLTLVGPGTRRIRYTLDRGTLVRQQRDGDTPGPAERFAVPMRTARFLIEPADGPDPFVTLIFDRRPGRRRGEPQEYRIDARLHADGLVGEASR